MNPLGGKVILVTGAKGGLGTFVTRTLLEAGASVTGVSRSIKDEDFEHARFAAHAATITSEDAASSAVQAVLNRFGRVDGLVHLMGGYAGGVAAHETPAATLDEMLDLNLRSVFLMTKAVLPAMREQGIGRIVAIGSRSAIDPAPGSAVYNASKAALVAFVRTVSLENRDRCISANVVVPGTMDTPANRAASPAADFTKWVQPIQVARLIAALVSDSYPQVNGAVIPIEGAAA